MPVFFRFSMLPKRVNLESIASNCFSVVFAVFAVVNCFFQDKRKRQLMIKNHKDFWSGLMFMAFGLGVIAIARHYPFGTTIRMGAGFFPMVLASLLAVFGLIIALRACLTKHKAQLDALSLKPLALVIAATALYGLLVQEAGFLAVTFVCVLVAAKASVKGSWPARLLLAVGTTLCCLLIFIQGLGLPLAVLGSWFK